jgi:phosphohistidine phosphatase SixA
MIRLTAFLFTMLLAHSAYATEAGWALLREGGHVALVRHAYAQGTTEPAGFDLDDCRTQRNLSDRGRQQARKIGSLFAARAAQTEEVVASRLCRAADTAKLAFGERNVEISPALDPITADDDVDARRAAILELIVGYTGSGNMVLMTDLSVINALTGQSAREGEAIIVRADDEALHVLARIIF